MTVINLVHHTALTFTVTKKTGNVFLAVKMVGWDLTAMHKVKYYECAVFISCRNIKLLTIIMISVNIKCFS